jgi:hypothetical protein
MKMFALTRCLDLASEAADFHLTITKSTNEAGEAIETD